MHYSLEKQWIDAHCCPDIIDAIKPFIVKALTAENVRERKAYHYTNRWGEDAQFASNAFAIHYPGDSNTSDLPGFLLSELPDELADLTRQEEEIAAPLEGEEVRARGRASGQLQAEFSQLHLDRIAHRFFLSHCFSFVSGFLPLWHRRRSPAMMAAVTAPAACRGVHLQALLFRAPPPGGPEDGPSTPAQPPPRNPRGADRARAERQTKGLIKVITTPSGRILGAGIAGHQAGELIGLWSLAISRKLKIGAIAGHIAPYPTLGEISKRVAGAWYTPSLFSKKTRKIVRLLLRLG